MSDPRLWAPSWTAVHDGARRRRLVLLIATNGVLAVWYFGWLLQPGRIGNPVLYGVLLAAEAFNLAQAVGFWWTCLHDRAPAPARPPLDVEVDVLIPTYGEPLDIVEPTLAAATRMQGRVRVHLLDDGPDPAKRRLAERYGANYRTRDDRVGAKAGSINGALRETGAPLVAVFDCDHVPDRSFLERTTGHFRDERVAFVQTPQYYANGRGHGVAAASWAQQALFFGPIARGKAGLDAMFCCGTNVVFRRTALDDVAGFPETSLTEDFELSVRLHERGWRSVYVPEVLASGLGPEDMASYVGQQHRWARGCLGAIRTVVGARLAWRVRLQYLLSSMFFLSGWTFLVYMSLPVIRLLTGAQPVDGGSADRFLIHFAPYFAGSLGAVALAGGGAYTFSAFTLMATNFWVHIHASWRALLGRAGSFVVTPKHGTSSAQPGTVAPALVMAALLAATAAFGLLRDRSPATLNNVAFAGLHICILLAGARPALSGSRRPRRRDHPVALLARSSA